MISKNQIKYIHQLELKKFRKQEGLFIAEGHKVVGDLLKAGYTPKQLFATAEWIANNPASQAIEVTNDELTRLSLLQHPQQVLGLFPIPNTQHLSPNTQQLSILLDNVQDPGNLGTIIRIADWFGIDTIFCSEGTVDAWNPKVVQATMGSIARVHLIYIDPQQLFDSLPADYPVYGTFLDGQNIYTETLTPNGLIVMGNEGNGISDAVRARISRKLLIPDFHQGDTADSLNVAIATAITCSEFRRR
ncbi:RNA methyltransferase [Prevotella sp. MA2016]|uniref:TrmH family RNA methyltransferase n=1 Tax=Prevotella sp. MA2016 TaxID=1408310 RepID=UPI00048EF066|nr:RNA methyltransferase [Prevotella sp. MA2016]